MLKKIRAALAPAGGASALLACAAIAWGLGRLQSLADERQAQLDLLAEATTAHHEAYEAAEARLAQWWAEHGTEPAPATAEGAATPEGVTP